MFLYLQGDDDKLFLSLFLSSFNAWSVLGFDFLSQMNYFYMSHRREISTYHV